MVMTMTSRKGFHGIGRRGALGPCLEAAGNVGATG